MNHSLIDNQPHREYCMDFLRVVAILLMFVYHVSMIFVAEADWHIKNSEQSRVLLEINEWLASFRMPLLFFVSGYISLLLLRKLRAASFVKSRFIRLIIPTCIWTFVLVAPQIYIDRKFDGADFNYIEFYKTFLHFSWYPEGNFHWFHLWFIPYLFVYNLLSIPMIYMLDRCTVIDECLKRVFSRLPGIATYSVFAIIPYTFLSFRFEPTYDLIHDYARHAYFIFFVLGGLLFCRYTNALEAVSSHRVSLFRYAFLGTIAINAIEWNDLEPWQVYGNWRDVPQTYLYAAFRNTVSWAWLLTFVGYAKQYVVKGNGLLSYCNSAVYPFYILHQTVIVIIGFYVIQTHDGVEFKYIFLLATCFITTIAIYHLFVRPFPKVRLLFGAK